tara:strand:- start:1012 stop:1977 length:966 start_codon:yes stop_codon:yes gene_type:complete
MALISNISSPISSTLGSFILNGNYEDIETMPNSLKKLVLESNKIIIVRETSETTDYKTVQTSSGPRVRGGGRTTGTMWYRGEILGFTVEDAVRDKKIRDVTAIPDTIIDPSKVQALGSHTYNIIRKGTGSSYISQTQYPQGSGLVLKISSKSDPTGNKILKDDVSAPENFSGKIAYTGVAIHQGGSENASSGCIIFGTQRKSDGKVSSNAKEIQALHKYLLDNNIIGSGKFDQLVIINLWEVPKDIPEAFGEIIDGETGLPIPGTKLKLELKAIPLIGLKEEGQEFLDPIPSPDLSKIKNPLSSDSLKSAKSSLFNFFKSK